MVEILEYSDGVGQENDLVTFDLPETAMMEADESGQCVRVSEQSTEGMSAFLEKRDPDYSGFDR